MSNSITNTSLLDTLTFKTEAIENTPNQKLINKVSKILENLGVPRGLHFRFDGKHSVVARIDHNTREVSIFVWDGAKDRLLTIKEVKALEFALEPAVEKYQQLKKAQADMEEALKKAGIDFAAYLNERG